jgi:hypothetical protein
MPSIVFSQKPSYAIVSFEREICDQCRILLCIEARDAVYDVTMTTGKKNKGERSFRSWKNPRNEVSIWKWNRNKEDSSDDDRKLKKKNGAAILCEIYVPHPDANITYFCFYITFALNDISLSVTL